VTARVRRVDRLRPQVQGGLGDEGERDRRERAAHRAGEARVRHHDDGRDQDERHQVREVGAAVEHVGEGRGRDARARRGDQERVPDSHGAPFPIG